MREYAFAPSPLALVPGETVRLTILDGGLAPHELVLGDAAVQAAWTAADAAATPGAFATPPLASVPPDTGGLRVLLESGQQTVVTYTVPMDERLTMVCHIADHRERGMEADVLLEQPAARSATALAARTATAPAAAPAARTATAPAAAPAARTAITQPADPAGTTDALGR
jgi:uncharacterized cupredoxin-like copper-binding protein